MSEAVQRVTGLSSFPPRTPTLRRDGAREAHNRRLDRPALALAVLTVAAAATIFTLTPNFVVDAQGGAIALPTFLQAIAPAG